MHNTIANLYEDYLAQRKINLTLEQFISFVACYPTLLVVHTDGRVDADEWRYIESLATRLSNLFMNEFKDIEDVDDLRNLFFKEFTYLLQHFDTWERRFIKALRNYLKEHPKDKLTVLQAMYVSAEVSEGICEKETIMIEHLKKELGIEEDLV